LLSTLSALVSKLTFFPSMAPSAIDKYSLALKYTHKYIISPESGEPIDEKVIKRYEKALEFSDRESENYVAGLAMLGMMYLQNAVAYDNKDLASLFLIIGSLIPRFIRYLLI